MKKGIFLIIFILSILMIPLIVPGFLSASEEIIYISETDIADTMSKSKTLISKFTPDGTELKKIYINGFMAKVSPNGKQIAYLEHKGDIGEGTDAEPIWEIALADENGQKIKNLPTFLNKEYRETMDTVKFAWSPDSKKIAFLQYLRFDYALKYSERCLIMLNVFDLASNELKNVFTIENVKKENSMDCVRKTTFYSIEWFSDNQRILMAGEGGIEIVDTKSKTAQTINKDSVFDARLTSDGKKIIYIIGKPEEHESLTLGNASVWQYDIQTKKDKKLVSIDMTVFLLMKSAFSHDNRFLALQILQPPKKRSFHIADLLNKKITEIYAEAEKLSLIPKEFSYYENNLVICIGIEKGEDEVKYSYGKFNTKNKKYHKFKEFVLKYADIEPIYPLARAVRTEVEWRKK